MDGIWAAMKSTWRRLGAVVFFGLLPTAMFGCADRSVALRWPEHSVGGMVGEARPDEQQLFWQAVRPVSSLASAHYRMGLHYQKRGLQDKAVPEFEKALRIREDYCQALNGIAMSFDVLDDCRQAEIYYHRATSCAPQQSYAWNNFGLSSIRCGKLQQGLSLLEQAGKLDGEDVRIRGNIRFVRDLVGEAEAPLAVDPLFDDNGQSPQIKAPARLHLLAQKNKVYKIRRTDEQQ